MKKTDENLVEVMYNNERHFLSPKEAKIAIAHLGAVEVVKFPKPVELKGKNTPPPISKLEPVLRVEPIPIVLKTKAEINPLLPADDTLKESKPKAENKPKTVRKSRKK